MALPDLICLCCCTLMSHLVLSCQQTRCFCIFQRWNVNSELIELLQLRLQNCGKICYCLPWVLSPDGIHHQRRLRGPGLCTRSAQLWSMWQFQWIATSGKNTKTKEEKCSKWHPVAFGALRAVTSVLLHEWPLKILVSFTYAELTPVCLFLRVRQDSHDFKTAALVSDFSYIFCSVISQMLWLVGFIILHILIFACFICKRYRVAMPVNSCVKCTMYHMPEKPPQTWQKRLNPPQLYFINQFTLNIVPLNIYPASPCCIYVVSLDIFQDKQNTSMTKTYYQFDTAVCDRCSLNIYIYF